MKIRQNDTWTRRGCSLIWDPNALISCAKPDEVISFREFIALSRNWPDELPSNDGYALIVAGVEGCLDVLEPDDAQTWIERDLRKLIFAFQDEYQNDCALIFWLPSGGTRFDYSLSTEEYSWKGSGQTELPVGRLLWAGARSDAERIDFARNGASLVRDAAGMYHPRIS